MKDIGQVKGARNPGLDMVKIIACLGVVSLHTLAMGKSILNEGLILLSALCIPLFFMVSGYLMMKREVLDYRYALKKILRILIICVSWEFLHAVAYFLYYRQMRNFLASFILDFFQEGLFFHFWYMGALILVYLAMPLLHKLLKKKTSAYGTLLAALSVICLAVDLAAIVAKRQFLLEIPQNLRCWTWLFYAMVGGYVAAKGNFLCRFDRLKVHTKIFLTVTMAVLCMLWQKMIGLNVFGSIVVEAFYGAFFTQLAVVCVFMLFRNMPVSGKTSEKTAWLSGLTMGVYIVHPFVLAVLKKFIPAFTQGGMLMNLLFWITTAAVSGGISCVMKKLPVLRQLIRL